MKVRSIIFSAPMVRAILDGHKVQTRRIVKPQPNIVHAIHNDASIETNLIFRGNSQKIHSPYGSPSDQLWVRENWRITAWDEDDGTIRIDYLADGAKSSWLTIPESADPDGEIFIRLWQQSSEDAEKAGCPLDEDERYNWESGQSPCRVRPSIYMPRWASRIALEITGIRVERLQEISEQNAISEGACPPLYADEPVFDCRLAYQQLWESVHGKGSWDKNPFVWVIEFNRIIQ